MLAWLPSAETGRISRWPPAHSVCGPQGHPKSRPEGPEDPVLRNDQKDRTEAQGSDRAAGLVHHIDHSLIHNEDALAHGQTYDAKMPYPVPGGG
jgi:hypothetical protein